MSMRDQPRSDAAEEGSQIELTPMLDVVFIMLIASWNGGSFYVEVFSRKYQKQLAESSRDGAV